MNERVKQLWAKAAESNFGDSWEEQTKFMEKFAELIVRECMKESMDEIVADEDIAQEKDPLIREYLTGNNQGIVDAVVRFRNHFGVEE
jgi:acetone carboxylase gamma subunit